MPIPIVPFGDLESRFEQMLDSIGYTETTRREYKRSFHHFIGFMQQQNLENYDDSVFKCYESHLENTTSAHSNDMAMLAMKRFNCYLQGIPYSRNLPVQKKAEPLSPEMEEASKAFVEELQSKRYAASMIDSYAKLASDLGRRLLLDGVSLRELSEEEVLAFAGSSQNNSPGRISNLRRFLAFLHRTDRTEKDFSLAIERIPPHRKEKLPSYYSAEEIARIEKAIPRASAVGKRDYAIVLLASRLGLRCSDIRLLQFSNLDWDRSEINLVQYKTKKDLTLPLLADVGEALIDYILHGRPESTSKYVFLSCRPAYSQLTTTALSQLIAKHIHESGVDYKGKHTGGHALRHSLATIMMNRGEALPTISATLGHSSTESTMFYMGVNVANLLECSHEVPMVGEEFYNQKGGVLYV